MHAHGSLYVFVCMPLCAYAWVHGFISVGGWVSVPLCACVIVCVSDVYDAPVCMTECMDACVNACVCMHACVCMPT